MYTIDNKRFKEDMEKLLSLRMSQKNTYPASTNPEVLSPGVLPSM